MTSQQIKTLMVTKRARLREARLLLLAKIHQMTGMIGDNKTGLEAVGLVEIGLILHVPQRHGPGAIAPEEVKTTGTRIAGRVSRGKDPNHLLPKEKAMVERESNDH